MTKILVIISSCYIFFNIIIGFANTFSYYQYQQKPISICPQKTCWLNPYYYPNETCFEGYYHNFEGSCVKIDLKSYETGYLEFLNKFNTTFENSTNSNGVYYYKASKTDWKITCLFFLLFSVFYLIINFIVILVDDDLIVFFYIILQWINILVYNLIINSWVNSDSKYFVNNGQSWNFLKTLEDHNDNLYFNFFIQMCVLIILNN